MWSLSSAEYSDVLSLLSLPLSWHKIHIKYHKITAKPAIAALLLTLYLLCWTIALHRSSHSLRSSIAWMGIMAPQGSLVISCHFVISCSFRLRRSLMCLPAAGKSCRIRFIAPQQHQSISTKALRHFVFTVMPLVSFCIHLLIFNRVCSCLFLC